MGTIQAEVRTRDEGSKEGKEEGDKGRGRCERKGGMGLGREHCGPVLRSRAVLSSGGTGKTGNGPLPGDRALGSSVGI